MQHKHNIGAVYTNLYPEIDRIQMSSPDRARAKAVMLRADYIADLLIAAANGAKAVVRWVASAVGSSASKPSTDAR